MIREGLREGVKDEEEEDGMNEKCHAPLFALELGLITNLRFNFPDNRLRTARSTLDDWQPGLDCAGHLWACKDRVPSNDVNPLVLGVITGKFD